MFDVGANCQELQDLSLQCLKMKVKNNHSANRCLDVNSRKGYHVVITNHH